MPALISHFKKALLISAACATLGFGVVNCAWADKSEEIQSTQAPSSNFFSGLLANDRPLIEAAINADLQNGKIDKVPFKDAAAMQAFYAARDGKPFWVDIRGDDHDRVADALKILDDAWTQALNPENYHVAQIHALLKADTPEDKAQLELLTTDAVIRYGHDMTGMHMPVAATQEDPQFWRKALDGGQVLAAVSDGDPAKTMNEFTPHDALYKRLREELIKLTNSPDRGASKDLQKISLGVTTLRPGEFNKSVPKLRERFGLTYDPANGPERKFDDALAEAVMNFQRENGMEPDGHLGPQTQAALNRTDDEKIAQIAANMERLRWLEEAKPDRYVLVNIPSQTLWAVDHGNVALQMPVIVGRFTRQTKIFVAHITGVRFNPTWTVPPTIKETDFLPKLQEDPNYLADKGINVSAIVDGKRSTVDPSKLDWANMTKSDLAQLHMVQEAGDNNALGKIRVLMDDPYDIYLHDTESPELFSKQERLLSSGCVRLSNPEAMARFILTNNDNWSDQRMRSLIDSGKTSEITAAAKIPVYIVYQTVWLDDAGRLVYGVDVYKKDKALMAAMNAFNVFHISDAQAAKVASIGSNSTPH